MRYIILGMHRSGTSMCAGLLERGGAAMPSDLIPGDEHNELGYYEPWRLVAANDSALALRSSSWLDVFGPYKLPVTAVPASSETSAFEQLVETQIPHQSFSAIKDPRFSYTLPLWRTLPAFEELNFHHVVMVRNPVDVAASLQRRNGFPLSFSLMLWAAYNLAAERNTRGLPRTFIDYDRLLADPVQELARAQLPVPDEQHDILRRFASTSLRHHRSSPELGPTGWACRVTPLWRWLQDATHDRFTPDAQLSETEAHLLNMKEYQADLIEDLQQVLTASDRQKLEWAASSAELKRTSARAQDLERTTAAEAGALAAELTQWIDLSQEIAQKNAQHVQLVATRLIEALRVEQA